MFALCCHAHVIHLNNYIMNFQKCGKAEGKINEPCKDLVPYKGGAFVIAPVSIIMAFLLVFFLVRSTYGAAFSFFPFFFVCLIAT